MNKPCENCGSNLRVCVDCSLHNGQFIEIPQNATNGDVIKAVFPNREVHDGYTVVYYGVEIRVDKDWWNAPYKAESEE